MQTYHFIIDNNFSNQRIDKVLAALLKENNISRSIIQKAILNNQTFINDVIVNDTKLHTKENDSIKITINIPKISLEPYAISLPIIYEDDDLIIINKPSGLTVHPGAGNYQDTLVNALINHTNDLSDLNGDFRLGIVHRLDKDTSGLMIVAKNNLAHNSISNQIQMRTLIRKYKALVWDVFKPLSGIINHNITRSNQNRTKMTVVQVGGREAITHYNTEKILLNGNISLIECTLKTGRTHQIRVHCTHLRHSIVGDQVYGNNSRKIQAINSSFNDSYLADMLNNLKRQALHSWYLKLIHPRTNEVMEFTSNLPQDIQDIVNYLEKI